MGHSFSDLEHTLTISKIGRKGYSRPKGSKESGGQGRTGEVQTQVKLLRPHERIEFSDLATI